jgi:hypothetical protein
MRYRAVVIAYDDHVGTVEFHDDAIDATVTTTVASSRAYGNFVVGWHGWAYKVDENWFWEGDRR